ncbi:MAG: SPOR domain-containing protein [Smithellaceae bacterium]|nr:SPOR domain-containing protein [Smithellaceae bacterium]
MYKDYYHLQTDPFNTHPNTDTFFISDTHKEAWYYLLFGIDTQEPFLLLTGEYGMGKTLLCLRLIKVLKEKGVPRVLYIPTSNEGYGGILRRIASSLGMSTTPEDEEILQDMIYDRFRGDTDHSRFYLIIDDAHELDATILTKLKYLSTFNHNEFFPVIMIFVGHPSFLQDLRTPALSSLNQRIKRRCHLAKFSLEDTKNYIYFRLMKSGATGAAFPDETIKKIFEYSGGVPRLINNISDTCLLIGASKRLIQIPPSVVDDAKILVEGILAGAKTEGGTDAVVNEAETAADSKNKAQTAITFSEDLPAGHAAGQAPVYATADTGEYQPVTIPPKVLVSGEKIKKFVIWVVVILLLILAGSWLYQNFMDGNKIINFFSPSTSEPQQNSTEQSEKAAVVIPAEKGAVVIPTLREEMTDKPSGEKPAPATSAPTDTPPKQAGGMQTQQPSSIEPASAGTRESFPFHPFSLRSSSYQQQEKAFQEISEIKQLGLTPYLVKTDLGDMGALWRIYIGFYSTEEEAKKIKATYKLANASVQKTEYACQVAEFSSEMDGINLFEKLKQSGYFPYAIQKGRNLFRLYLGAYEKKSEAEALQKRLQEKGIKSQVVKR